MTEKQQGIVHAALELFAKDGVDATSTSKIAKLAGVSEGLIFRHFTNKEGLLQVILTIGLEKSEEFFETISLEKDPKERIRKALHLPFDIDPEDYNFWRLVYTLKWQRGMSQSGYMDVFRASLAEAFLALNYDNPSAEARLVEAIIDGIATEVLLKDLNAKPLLNCILDKYKLR